MACEPWTEKLDAYLDGELPASEARALAKHLRGCAACAAEGLRKVQLKRAVQAAGQRFMPDPAFRARMQDRIAGRRPFFWRLRWLPILATAAVMLLAGALFLTLNRSQQPLISELVDQHVATLASLNPVDVISTDRHTVKPWFAGKLPFTFNLPELQNSPFKLIGGRVTYFEHNPGAQLLFQIRSHQLSVFIFQDQPGMIPLTMGLTAERELDFNVDTWSEGGLRYVVIGDASSADVRALSDLLRSAK